MTDETRVPSRFDYVAYDAEAKAGQATLKAAAQKVEAALIALEDARQEMATAIEAEIGDCEAEGGNGERALDKLNRATGLELGDALRTLEESYMWCGKAIRDEQIARNGSAPLEEGRTDG